MKKYLFFLLLIFSLQGISQVTLDFAKPGKSLVPVSISQSEKKYICTDWDTVFQNNYFDIVNSDGSLYKQINLPAKPPYAQGIQGIYYVSLSLFDTDSTNLEYLIVYNCDSVTTYDNLYNRIKIVREDGTILLDQYYAFLLEESYSNGVVSSLFEMNNQAKLILWYFNTVNQLIGTKIFTLGGQIPTNVEKINSYNNQMTVFPNPNNGNFFVKINSIEKGLYNLQLFSTDGKLVTTFHSSENPASFSGTSLPDGVYYLKMSQKNSSINVSKMVIKN
jgi:hypothetical protein